MPRRVRTTPRKRPRQARSRATVDAILEATAQVLVAEGYDKTSTNRVAERAGVSVGSVYQYFPNKEALVGELVDRYSREIMDMVFGRLTALAENPPGEICRYGVAFPFQVAPRLAAVLCCLRNEGHPVGDFENGSDVFLFDDLDRRRGPDRPQ